MPDYFYYLTGGPPMSNAMCPWPDTPSRPQPAWCTWSTVCWHTCPEHILHSSPCQYEAHDLHIIECLEQDPQLLTHVSGDAWVSGGGTARHCHFFISVWVWQLYRVLAWRGLHMSMFRMYIQVPTLVTTLQIPTRLLLAYLCYCLWTKAANPPLLYARGVWLLIPGLDIVLWLPDAPHDA